MMAEKPEYDVDAEVVLQMGALDPALNGVPVAVFLDPLALNICLQGPSDSGSPLPLTVTFAEIEFKVMLKAPQSPWDVRKWRTKGGGEEKERSILRGISGVVKAGEMLGMLGPSGSGKTTLLRAIGGRLKGKLSGKVLYNNVPYNKAMKRRAGYVSQDDLLHPHLTVKETLEFAALLRLPRSMTKSEKLERAAHVILELGLEKCKDTIIGSHRVRGVSGGERKRVSIGHEMLINPSLLLLDEPTSGLDSTTAYKIILVLQRLAKGGRTVITTVHQPSTAVYHMLDKVILLSEGCMLYFGPSKEATNYFDSIGFSPAMPTNPAEFLLDLASGVTANACVKEDLVSSFFRTKVNINAHDLNIRETLEECHAKFQGHLDVDHFQIVEFGECREKLEKLADGDAIKEKPKLPTTWGEQVLILMARGWKEKKHEAFAGLKLFQMAATTVIVGVLWFRTKPYDVQDQVGLIFFMTLLWSMTPVFNALFVFPQERDMLMKERASGTYHMSAYFVAQTIADLPLELIIPTLFLIVVYWMTGLLQTFRAFIVTLLILLYNVLAGQGMGMAIGAAFMDVRKASAFASIVMHILVASGGFLVQNMPRFVCWIKYLSFFYYTYKLQIINQFSKPRAYHCTQSPNGICYFKPSDNPVIQELDLHGSNTLMCVLVLTFMQVLFRVYAFYCLKTMKSSR